MLLQEKIPLINNRSCYAKRMIITEKNKEIPATVVHRITGDITVEEAEWAVKAAVELFESEIEKCGNINVIINAQGVNFTSLIAHKTWSVGLRSGCDPLKERINYGIMVLDDVPNARAERS